MLNSNEMAEDWTVSRRSLLVSSAGVSAGLAGCSSESDPESTETTGAEGNSPESPVLQHYQAMSANDFEAANAAIHSDSPRGKLPDEAIERGRRTTYNVDSVEVFDGDTETPEVAVTITATNTDTEEARTFDLRIEVRKDDGVWKMYQIVE